MNPDHYSSALYLLENPQVYPGLVDRKGEDVRLRVWTYPSFKPHCAWAIIETNPSPYVSRAQCDLFLRRVVWDQTQARPFLIEPVSYGSETAFPRVTYDSLLSELGEIRAAPFQNNDLFGVDGTSYGVERTTYGLRSRLSWWETPPSTWADLERWHHKAVELFESLLPMQSLGLRQK